MILILNILITKNMYILLMLNLNVNNVQKNLYQFILFIINIIYLLVVHLIHLL